MKCKVCGQDMREWQRTLLEGNVVIRYHCDMCDTEEAEIESPPKDRPPKYKLPKKLKED